MANGSLKSFLGMRPRSDSKLLKDQEAVEVVDAKLWSGALQPYLGPKFHLTPSKIGTVQSLYRFGAVPGNPDSGFFFHWIEDVDVIRGVVKGDTTELTLFTGDGAPKFTDVTIATLGGTEYPTNSFLLGIPAPASGPILTVVGTIDPDAGEDDVEPRAYALTDIGARGEEGPPVFSEVINVSPGQSVDLSYIDTGPSGNYDITGKRLYRTVAGNTSEFYPLVDLGLGITGYSDTLDDDDQLGDDALQTYTWEPPPSDMHSINVLPNGIVYGFSKNRVCVSVAFTQYAFNPLHQQVTNYDVIGGGHFDNTIVAVTEKNPHLITGVDPSAMSVFEYTIGQGCASKRSCCNSEIGFIYASFDGLMLLNSQGAQRFSRQHYTQDEWVELNPSSMLCIAHDGRVIVFYEKTNGDKGGLIFDLEEGNTLVKTSVHASAVFADHLSERLYLVVDDNICIWDAGSALTLEFKSKEWVAPDQKAFTAVIVRADSYANTTFKWIVDGVEKYSVAVTSALPFRLPQFHQPQTQQFQLLTTDRVTQIELGETVANLNRL